MRPKPRNARRIALRPYRLSDWTAWREGYETHLRVAGGSEDFTSDELTRDVFRERMAQHRRGMARDLYYALGIFHRRSGRWLGGVVVLVVGRLDMQLGQVGYFLHRQHEGKGYATEALPLAFQVAFDDLHLHRLEASIRPENARSLRLAERAGMQRECLRRSWSWDDDGWADHVIYVTFGTDDPPRVKPWLRDVLA